MLNIKEYVEFLRKFKETEEYANWKNFARACEFLMKNNPKKYKVRFYNTRDDSWKYCELASVDSYRDSLGIRYKGPYFEEFTFSDQSRPLEEAKNG